MGNQKEKPDRSCTGVVYQKVTPNVPESRSSRETSGDLVDVCCVLPMSTRQYEVQAGIAGRRHGEVADFACPG